MDPFEKWRWVARFADRLMALRPGLWLPTATAIGLMAHERYSDLEPEVAAERYVQDEAGDEP
jgi:hypothetical protein